MKDRLKSYVFILILAVIVCIPLFNKDFDVYGDDGIQHVCRLMGTWQSIEEGQAFPVIMSNFCNNFGYSWNLFYSPITAYIPLLLKLFTNSYVIMLKIFMLIVSFLTGISMYEFLAKVTKNKYAGLIGAAIYIFTPYRLTDMYMRIAIAELTSFIFLPMVFQGLYNIFNYDEEDKKKSGILLSIGAIGLILTHIIMAMYTAIFGVFYVLIHIKKLKDKIVLKKLFLNLLFIICITSFFIAPLLEHKLSTQYEVFKPGRMEREEVLVSYKINGRELFYTGQGNLALEIGLVTVIGFILSIFAVRKLEKRYTNLYVFSIFASVISIIMTMKWFPFEKLPDILTMLQFPFRMLEFSSFFLTVVVAINYSLVVKNFKMRDVIILSMIAILLVVPLKKNLKYRYNISEDRLWPAVAVTENTKRVHAGCASFEYLPSKAFENLGYIKTRKNTTYIVSGNANIIKEEKNGTNMLIELSNCEKDTTLELPYVYYLGYTVKLENEGGIKQLKAFESDKGFVAVKLDNKVETGKLIVEYTGTNIMKISMAISVMAFTVMILYYLKKKKEGN